MAAIAGLGIPPGVGAGDNSDIEGITAEEYLCTDRSNAAGDGDGSQRGAAFESVELDGSDAIRNGIVVTLQKRGIPQ